MKQYILIDCDWGTFWRAFFGGFVVAIMGIGILVYRIINPPRRFSGKNEVEFA